MHRQAIIGCTLLLAFLHYAWPEEKAKSIEEIELRTASAKASKLVQHSQVAWYKKQRGIDSAHGSKRRDRRREIKVPD